MNVAIEILRWTAYVTAGLVWLGIAVVVLYLIWDWMGFDRRLAQAPSKCHDEEFNRKRFNEVWDTIAAHEQWLKKLEASHNERINRARKNPSGRH